MPVGDSGVTLISGSSFPVPDTSFQVKDAITKHDKKPIVIVIPGLTSDSSSANDFGRFLEYGIQTFNGRVRAEVALRGEGDNGAEGNLKTTNNCLEAKRDDCLLGDEGGAQPLFTEGFLRREWDEPLDEPSTLDVRLTGWCHDQGTREPILIGFPGPCFQPWLASQVEERSNMLLKGEWGRLCGGITQLSEEGRERLVGGSLDKPWFKTKA
ncbi:hypothetical protein Acr_06g0013170 [Actinidia rufa]|uniref:Alpha/beta-Hydrolases superfamily protein n=1 Tax=Actinidia rufa TaxID=165716 RepID=A0A7J0EUW5_9ERIC|nr:hypothetical protein Acr_06g0013170 [Actinidia rufa]